MKQDIEVTLNNIKKITVPLNTTIMQIVLNNSDICQNKIVGAKIDNQIVDFKREIKKSVNIELFDINDIDGYKMNQAGLKFVLEVALKNNYLGSEVSYDHSIGNGIHTTIKNVLFTKNDVEKLKKEMDLLIEQDLVIQKIIIENKEAINFYKSKGYVEKEMNAHNISGGILSIYKLGKYYNYFYSELPYSTGYIDDFELVYINDNELAITLPINHTFNLVEYKKYEKISECFKKDMELLNKYNMPYICDINKQIAMGNARNIIRLFETHFDNNVHEIAAEVISKNVKYLLIAGPSSSGKTTTAKKIALNIQSMGYHPTLISTDDYFVNRDDSPKNPDGTFDFESIKCVDVEKLNNDLNDLINGKEVYLPHYNFKTGTRVLSEFPTKLDGNSIIVIEGIHCLNDELIPRIDKSKIYRVYLSPFMATKLDRHNYLSTADLRLIRRIIRDNNNRGCNISRTIELWNGVRHGEEENIFPYLDKANVIINTALPYELSVLKIFVVPLLYSVESDSPYIEEARRLIKYLDNIYPISSEYVEEDSILREFIGGSIFKGEKEI